MAHTKASSIKLHLAVDIDCLASKIITLANDPTIFMAARGIAQHMLLSANIEIGKALELFDKPGAVDLLWKLIKSQSDFMGPTPRSIGIDIVSECAASKIQSSLDVKHIKKATVEVDTVKIDRIKPHRKIDLAFSHPTSIWIRYYSDRDDIEINNTTILKVSEDVYEMYCSKNIQMLFNILTTLENEYNVDLIFCSELPAFSYNPLLFLSNYIKFMWCYALNRDIFNPTSYDDVRILSLYTTYGLMFLNTNNLSSMPSTTHGPMISCSGERPKVALGKFDPNKEYINEGSRAMQSLNKPSDFGTCSNFIEIITEIDLSNTNLSRIV
ncbi:OrNV p47-like [Tomelloso virus]|uniref:OrNV p47-like n=1 Tax=Tomelloso virus TaxID=2053981 RepID=A0A2H4T2Q6_9VIRU|nr:OrNV p47-like [Tomelloso virus]ATY70215.1 OrNV p47-like [Tomelloso virus]